MVNVNGVTEGLQGIEAYANRQYDIQGMKPGRLTKEAEGCVEILDKEIVVFEKSQNSQVYGQTGHQPPPFLTFIFSLIHHQAGNKIDTCTEDHQTKKAPIPPAIEKET